ncbi:MAG TPA: hypothetical protein VES42_06275, partial [Pilimelia sp.]|nr:hypothetical protein [Pilimelia sp.]
MADRSEPWAEQTVEVAGQFPPGQFPPGQPPRPAFHRGVAPVGGPRSPADHDGRGGDEEHRRGYADTWPGPGDSFAPARPPMRHQLRQLRR